MTRDPEQPLDLRRAEVGIRKQAGPVPQHLFDAVTLEFGAAASRSPVLPHNGACDGFQRAPVPEHHGFALVGDADSRRHFARLLNCITARLDREPEDFLRVVLYPARLREVLGERAIARTQHASILLKDEGVTAGGALIEGEDGGHDAWG